MKKCLQLSVLPLLLSAVLFCSCKDDNPGNPNPIVDASVQDAKVTIDQANKRIDVLFYEYNPLSAVEITFKFVDGAYLYTPLMKNPATLDLSNAKYGSTIVVQTGDDLVYYDVYGAVDYPIMGMVATADDGKIEGRVVFDQSTREITVEFNYVIDPTKVDCSFSLSPEGGKLIGLTNPCVLDMSKDQTITAESDKSGGPVTYKLKAVQSADVSIVPDGWEKVSGYTMPSHMALYKTNMLYENEAYVLVADKRAKFSVLSNGYKFLTTLPEFYQQDPTAAVIINGSATDDMIVVDGQVVNQGRQTTTAGFGVTKAGTILIGDNFKVEWDKVKQNDSTAHYAMYAVQSLIEKGTLQDGLDAETKDARAAIGVTSRGYYVFFVCQKYTSPGITVEQQRDIMADWACYYAVGLQGGSGSCMLVGGQRTIYSSKTDASTGLTDKDYYKPVGCVGVLK
ncbi:MAG: phosphodiester glycosidase family protein [Alistipes indistinctus]|nr:phosphodiester glycosidase family protein [Alistipes indistinctus]